MLHRALALAAAVVIPLLAMIPALGRLHPAMFWVGPILAAACAIPIVLRAGEARTQAVVGAALAAMAAGSSPEIPELIAVTGEQDALEVHDLLAGPLPETAEGHVAIRGYLRREWVVDEYRVAEGQRPDQNEEAEAVLLPLLGTEAKAIETNAELGRVVVARVRPAQLRGPALVTLRGRLTPVGPEIVDSLFVIQIDEQGVASGVQRRPRAIELDTLDMPTRGQAITQAALTGGAALLALLLLLLSAPARARGGTIEP